MNASEEEFIPEDEADEGPGLVKKLREKLTKAIEEKQEYLDGWQRARADFANYKREEAAQSEEREARTKADLIHHLLPVLDSFELSAKHNPPKEVLMLKKQLESALHKLGVEQYGAPGDTFDPKLHEALRQVETSNSEEDHLIESVERSGYKSNNHIIRAAQVTIKNYHG